MSDDAGALGAQRDDLPDEETGLVPGQDAQAPSDDGGGTTGGGERGAGGSAFTAVKESSEKSFKRFTLIFAVSHLILAVRTSSTPCATRPFPADR